jgi:hypothetical protein
MKADALSLTISATMAMASKASEALRVLDGATSASPSWKSAPASLAARLRLTDLHAGTGTEVTVKVAFNAMQAAS